MDVVTLGVALNGSKKYTDQVTQSLMGGVHYRGSVNYYTGLPNDASEGDSYTVDTTVQPSEFTATWTGWHNASVKEWDGSQWNE